MRRPIALIGPAGVGKSTSGEELAELLSRTFVDVDDVGDRYYDAVGQPVAAFIAKVAADGFATAHRWWQPARIAALATIADHPSAVIAFGAGHSHYESDRYAEIARRAFGAAFVVLLLPSPDSVASVAMLRERCVRHKHTDWIVDGHDYLAEWTESAQNLDHANLVVYCDDRSTSEVASQIAHEVRRAETDPCQRSPGAP